MNEIPMFHNSQWLDCVITIYSLVRYFFSVHNLPEGSCQLPYGAITNKQLECRKPTKSNSFLLKHAV